MKHRHGFVSNSSSSSFIIGLGVVKDKDAFMKTYNAIAAADQYNDINFKTVKELGNACEYFSGIKINSKEDSGEMQGDDWVTEVESVKVTCWSWNELYWENKKNSSRFSPFIYIFLCAQQSVHFYVEC